MDQGSIRGILGWIITGLKGPEGFFKIRRVPEGSMQTRLNITAGLASAL